jgi:hypothetical protein
MKTSTINVISLIVGIFGIIVGIFGIGYAVYENKTKNKLSDYIRAQNWYLYSKANNATGHVQHALSTYKKISPDCMNLDVFEWLAKADAFSQDVFKDIIRQIQVSEPVFDSKTIKEWISEGRIKAEHANLFETLTPTNQSSGTITQIQSTQVTEIETPNKPRQ